MPIDDDFPNEPEPATAAPRAQLKKRKSGIPTGNAGEYFVMGELLRRGFDAQLADRNTKGYDLLVGRADEQTLRKVQIKSVRAAPWFVSVSHFKDDLLNQVTVYVLLGPEDSKKAVRFFIARNAELKKFVSLPLGVERARTPFSLHAAEGFRTIRKSVGHVIELRREHATAVSARRAAIPWQTIYHVR